jgi:4-amino-4-deoxy-L-arabinose transferase-like glycosyltransferase
MCEMKTIPGVLRNMLNVNLDAGLLLFWTLVYCCFGRCALSYGDGLWSAPLAALSVSNRVGSYP